MMRLSTREAIIRYAESGRAQGLPDFRAMVLRLFRNDDDEDAKILQEIVEREGDRWPTILTELEEMKR